MGSILRNNRRMFWEILNRIMGRKKRIIGTGLHMDFAGIICAWAAGGGGGGGGGLGHKTIGMRTVYN